MRYKSYRTCDICGKEMVSGFTFKAVRRNLFTGDYRGSMDICDRCVGWLGELVGMMREGIFDKERDRYYGIAPEEGKADEGR